MRSEVSNISAFFSLYLSVCYRLFSFGFVPIKTIFILGAQLTIFYIQPPPDQVKLLPFDNENTVDAFSKVPFR